MLKSGKALPRCKLACFPFFAGDEKPFCQSEIVLSARSQQMAQKQKPKGQAATPGPAGKKEAGAKKAPPVRKSGGFFARHSFRIALFLIAFLVFGNGIYNEYALDDEFYTAGANKLTLQGVKGIPKIFTSHTFYNTDGSGYAYRPVVLTSFALEIQFFGEQPHVSHFFNVLLYGLSMVLLFSLLRRWFVNMGDWFSFFVCLLFLAHPLHTEVVDNIKCRDEILAMLFTIIAMLFVWKHIETKKAIYLFLAPASFFLGVLSKHTILPFLALVPLAIWFFTDVNWKRILLFYALPFLGFALLSVLIQKNVLPPMSRTFQAFENPLPEGQDFMVRTATSFYVLGRYIWLHFIPYPLVYYYGHRYIPLVGWTNIIAIVSLLVHIALGLLALRELRKKSILGFGLLFYLINIAVYSNLLRPAPGIMAERFTYAASLGFCIVIVVLVFRIMKQAPEGFRWKLDTYKSTRAVFLFLALLFTVRCWFRNADWENKEVLYGHDMQYLHESAKANMLYGALISVKAMRANIEARQLREKGNTAAADQKSVEAKNYFLSARGYYKQAADVAPYYHTAWGNLGTTYFFVDQPEEALPYFFRSVKENPKYTEGYFNLGMAYDKLDKKDSAEYFFRKSISCDSTYLSSYEQLSKIIFNRDKDTQGALDILHAAARNRPDSDVPWNNIASIYNDLKDTASSAAALEMAAQINPSNLQRLYNLANYFRYKGDIIKYNYYMATYQEEMKKQEKVPAHESQDRARPRR